MGKFQAQPRMLVDVFLLMGHHSNNWRSASFCIVDKNFHQSMLVFSQDWIDEDACLAGFDTSQQNILLLYPLLACFSKSQEDQQLLQSLPYSSGQSQRLIVFATRQTTLNNEIFLHLSHPEYRVHFLIVGIHDNQVKHLYSKCLNCSCTRGIYDSKRLYTRMSGLLTQSIAHMVDDP